MHFAFASSPHNIHIHPLCCVFIIIISMAVCNNAHEWPTHLLMALVTCKVQHGCSAKGLTLPLHPCHTSHATSDSEHSREHRLHTSHNPHPPRHIPTHPTGHCHYHKQPGATDKNTYQYLHHTTTTRTQTATPLPPRTPIATPHIATATPHIATPHYNHKHNHPHLCASHVSSRSRQYSSATKRSARGRPPSVYCASRINMPPRGGYLLRWWW